MKSWKKTGLMTLKSYQKQANIIPELNDLASQELFWVIDLDNALVFCGAKVDIFLSFLFVVVFFFNE